MSKTYIPVEIRRRVAESARYLCGYCLTSQHVVGFPMHVEHIIPESAGGNSDEKNLWLACPLCNGYKGTKTHAVDPELNREVPLFNPRTQNWRDHFNWSEDGTNIIGKTPIGQATIIVLQLNNKFVVPSRKVWVRANLHPPDN